MKKGDTRTIILPHQRPKSDFKKIQQFHAAE
jgi:hypothetical protein